MQMYYWLMQMYIYIVHKENTAYGKPSAIP